MSQVLAKSIEPFAQKKTFVECKCNYRHKRHSFETEKPYKMLPGLRVVRGPDWKYDNQDGGQDHVGTVVAEQGENSVKVQWDMGASSICKVGDGAQELRIFDSASIGITHPNNACAGCEEVCIVGTLWKCSVCPNTNLCSLCYHGDKHDLAHTFVRIDFPGSEPVNLPKRLSSQRSRALGIYPNATVVRGPNWEYENQDGGTGSEGIVEDVVNFGQDATDRNAVRVRWRKGNTGIYRLGYHGNVDLSCVEESPGGSFYPEHLATLDVTTHAQWGKSAEVMCVGDKVCVEMTSEQLKQLHQGRLNWNTRMDEVIGEVGIIKSFTSEGDIEVDYDGDAITLVKAAVCKVPSHDKGDKVQVIANRDKMKRLQRKHGGWDDNMSEVMGQVATVSVVDKDGDVGVIFEDGTGFVFHPACLVPLQKSAENDDTESEEEDEDDDKWLPVDTGDGEGVENESSDDDDQEEDDEGDDEEGVDLMQALAGLLLLEALSSGPDTSAGQTFLSAIVQGNVSSVEQMLRSDPELKDLKQNNIPCLLLAAYHGHVAILKVLLDVGAKIDVTDDKGNSALIIAISADKGDAAKYLITRGADIKAVNKNGRTPAHAAAIKNMTSVLKILLEQGCNPNAQDVVGDTPLHDAISERHDEAATILIQHPDVNVWLQNVKLFNVMHLACMKAHACAVDKLLSKEPKLVSSAKSDGFLPLHITAVNNHINEANILLVKGRADVNAKTLDKSTALHLAASQANFDMVKLLLTYEADWAVTDSNGNTPLHVCMMGRRTNELFLQLLGLRNLAEDTERIKIANFLIQHGAKIDDKNNAGNTPLTGCGIQHMRDAVSAYAANNKPTAPPRPKARPRTAKVEQEMFTTSKQKCHKCAVELADVRFLPCKHQISCPKCCFKYKKCPICDKEITKRVDNDNHVVESGCVIA